MLNFDSSMVVVFQKSLFISPGRRSHRSQGVSHRPLFEVCTWEIFVSRAINASPSPFISARLRTPHTYDENVQKRRSEAKCLGRGVKRDRASGPYRPACRSRAALIQTLTAAEMMEVILGAKTVDEKCCSVGLLIEGI